MRVKLTPAAAAVVLGALSGCATTHRDGNPHATAAALPGTPDCLFLGNYEGDWQVLNDSTLIFYAYPSDREAYLIKLFQPVSGLKFHLRLGLYDVQRTGRICGNGNAYLLVPDYAPRRILITAVHKLTRPERDQLLARAGHPPSHQRNDSGASPR